MIPTDSDFNQCLSGLQELSHFGALPVAVAADARIRRKLVSLVSGRGGGERGLLHRELVVIPSDFHDGAHDPTTRLENGRTAG